MKKFNEYISNILNESTNNQFYDDKNHKILWDKIEEFFNKNKVTTIEINDLKELYSDRKKEFEDDLKTQNKTIKKYWDIFKKKYILKSKSKNNDFNNDEEIKIFTKDDFNKLGKVIGYRSALAIAVNGEDFTKIAREVFEDESEYSIKQLNSIEDLLNLASAKSVLNIEEKHFKKDQAKIQFLNGKSKELVSEDTRYETIMFIKEQYTEEFNKQYEIYSNSFEQGIKEQQNEMTKPDYEWKDPITGEPPKGFKGNLTKFTGKGLAKLGEIGKNIESKISNKEHTLENDMAKLAVLGVKGLLGIAHGIVKGITSIIIARNNSKSFSDKYKKTKLDEVKNKINEFKKSFKEYKKITPPKENSNTQIKFFDRILTEDNNSIDEYDNIKQKIKMQFITLLSETILPYYFYKMSNITYSFENKNNLYIITKTNNGWNTLNTSSGNLTFIEDNKILMLNFLKYINNELREVFIDDYIKTIPAKDVFGNIPDEIVYNNKLNKSFKDWCNNISDEEIKNNMLKFLNIYNKDIIISAKSLKYKSKTMTELFNILGTFEKNLLKEINIKPITNNKIEFKSEDIDINIPGIIIGKKDNNDLNDEENDTRNIKTNTKKLVNQIKIRDENLKKLKDLVVGVGKDEILKCIKQLEEESKIITPQVKEILEDENNKDNENIQICVNIYKDADEYHNHIIFNNWFDKYLISKVYKEKNESYIDFLLDLLNEKYKPSLDKLTDSIIKLLSTDLNEVLSSNNYTEFKKNYGTWLHTANSIIKNYKSKSFDYNDPLSNISAIVSDIISKNDDKAK